MNFGEMKDYCATQLDDLNQGYFTDSILSNYVNNAQYEVHKLCAMAGEGYFSICVSAQLVMNQREYVLPSDFFKLEKLEIILSGTPPNESTTVLVETTPMQVNNLGFSVGMPQVFYFKKTRIALFPAPDGGANNLTLRMLYTPKPLPMTLDNESSVVPIEYHEFICVLAIIDGLLRDGRDVGPYVEKRQYYEEKLKRAAVQRSIAQSKQVITGPDFDGIFPFY